MVIPPSKLALFLPYVNDTPRLSADQTTHLRVILDSFLVSSHHTSMEASPSPLPGFPHPSLPSFPWLSHYQGSLLALPIWQWYPKQSPQLFSVLISSMLCQRKLPNTQLWPNYFLLKKGALCRNLQPVVIIGACLSQMLTSQPLFTILEALNIFNFLNNLFLFL